MPRVSIIIPAYNAQGFIGEALHSVRAQTFGDWEILLVDDGSEDATRSEAERSGVPLRCLSQPHRGPGAARNLGLKECAGEFVAFLDADDRWLPDKLDLQVRELEERMDAGAVYTDVQIVEDGHPPSLKSDVVELPSGWIAERILREPRTLLTSSLLFRRELWSRVGPFEEGTPIAEDWEWFVRLACRAPIQALARPLVEYRVHAGNTHRSLDANAPHALRMFARAMESFETAGGRLTPELRSHVLYMFYSTYGIGYLFSWRSWKSLPYFLRAVRHRPSDARLYLYSLASLLPGAALRGIQRLRGRAV